MLEYLHIKNFQSHKDTLIHFSDNITAIAGISDSGKTALLRSLRWLVSNRPTGDAFRSSWGGDTSVEIGIDGLKIGRKKTNSKNIYYINDDEFAAVGVDVPSEIQKILNLTEINIQQQLDAPFLLTKSPWEVAKHFNRMAGLNVIDNAMTEVESNVRSIQQIIKFESGEIKETETGINELGYLPSLEKEADIVIGLDKKLSMLTTQKGYLDKLCRYIVSNEIDIQRQEKLIEPEQEVNAIINLLNEKQSTLYRYNKTNDIITSIQGIDKQIEEEKIKLHIENDCQEILDLITTRNGIKKDKIEAGGLLRKIHYNTQEIENMELKISNMEDIFKKEMPDICPLCGRSGGTVLSLNENIL